MQELIKVEKRLVGTEETNSVDAKELHVGLEIKKDFTTWIKAQLNSLGLEKNIDYVSSKETVKAGAGTSTRTIYILTLDTAKHIAMSSRTPKGKEVRNYFIAVEKQSKEQLPQFDQIISILDHLAIQQAQILQLMQMMLQKQEKQVAESLTSAQLDKIKLAVSRAAAPLADMHNLTFSKAVKETYSALNGRMGVFTYYHILPADFDEAIELLKKWKVQKEDELLKKKSV